MIVSKLEGQWGAVRAIRLVLLTNFAFIALASSVLRSADTSPHEPCIEFEISLGKPRYVLGEDVWLRIVLANNCDSAVTVTELSYLAAGLRIDLVDSSGKRLSYTGFLDVDWYPGFEARLGAGESQGLLISLVESHGRHSSPVTFGQLLPTGKYRVSCRFYSASAGSFDSDTLAFSIEAAAGDTAKALAAYVALEDSAATLLHKFYREHRKEGLLLYSEYITTYPKSPVAPRLLNTLESLDRVQAGLYADWMISWYPESPWSAPSLLDLLYADGADRREILRSVANQHSGSHLRQVARDVLAGRRPVCTFPKAMYRIARELQEEPR